MLSTAQSYEKILLTLNASSQQHQTVKVSSTKMTCLKASLISVLHIGNYWEINRFTRVRYRHPFCHSSIQYTNLVEQPVALCKYN